MASVLKIQVETGSWLPILGEGRFRRVPLLGYLEQLLILGQFSGWKEGAQVVILIQMNLDNLANGHVSNSAAGPVDGFHLVFNFYLRRDHQRQAPQVNKWFFSFSFSNYQISDNSLGV